MTKPFPNVVSFSFFFIMYMWRKQNSVCILAVLWTGTSCNGVDNAQPQGWSNLGSNVSNGIEMSLIFLQTVLVSFPAPVVFRRWRNVIVVKIILCSARLWGGEVGQMATSFIRISSEAGWPDNPIKRLVWLRAVWAYVESSERCGLCRNDQWAFVRMSWFPAKKPATSSENDL